MKLLVLSLLVSASLGEVANTPPRGWRSWNAFLLDITQTSMLAQVDAMIAPGPNGGKSLAALGFASGGVGLDDGWQACGEGVKGGFHDSQGRPIVNTTRFPDMRAMNREAKSKGVSMGWYLNNCWCCETGRDSAHYAEDVSALFEFEFDSVKIDGCGPAHNITMWTDEIAKYKSSMMVENCGDNHQTWSPPLPKDVETCPFNMYRISSDIAPQFYSTMYNLQYLSPFLDPETPLSRPGCWAYPDMLQVGNRMTAVESRSHFGAWCITSSPLILGFDLTNQQLYNDIYKIISNEDALRINEVWAGHPGRLILSANASFSAPVAHGADCGCCDDLSKCDKYVFPLWQVWAKPLPNNEVAILIINLSEAPLFLPISLSSLSLPFASPTCTSARGYDVWGRMDIGDFKREIKVHLDSHDSAFYVLSKSGDCQ